MRKINIEIGQELTIANQMIGENGAIKYEIGQKVIVRDIDISPEYFSNSRYIPETVNFIKIEKDTGLFTQQAFIEPFYKIEG